MKDVSRADTPLGPLDRSVSEGGRRLLDHVLKVGGVSQASLPTALDLSQPTVARLLGGFVQDGMVFTAGRQVDRPGNPSVSVQLNGDFAFSFGVSLMGDVLSACLVDFAGVVRGERRLPMPVMGRREVLTALVQWRGALLAEAGVDPRRVIGVGVGMSGFFVGERARINPPAYLDDWALVDVEPIIEEALGYKVFLDNDGNAAAVGESLYGVGRHCRNFVYLHLTNGFGGGIIAEGRPFRGRHGNAGEFGGVWARLGGPYPNLDRLKTLVAETGLDFDTVEDMVQVIGPDTPGVEAWLDEAVAPFSLLADIVAHAIDPEMVVIGGRLPRSIAEILAARIGIPRENYRRERPPIVPKVVVAEAPNDSVATGAAAMPFRAAYFI